MPDTVRVLGKRNAAKFVATAGVEQTQVHLRCIAGVDGEIRALCVDGCAEGIGRAGEWLDRKLEQTSKGNPQPGDDPP